MHLRHRQLDGRAGFTLAEMLIILAIIMVLFSLSAAAILKFGNVGPHQATVANLSKVKSALDAMWTEVAQKARTDQINMLPGELDTTNTIKSLADGRARQKFIEFRLAQAFPISFVEVLSPLNTKMGAYPAYKSYLRDLNIKTLSDASNFTLYPPDLQQAVCLQMILERGPSNPGLSPDKLGASMSVKMTGINAYGCVDGWGRSFLFSRNYKGVSNTLGLVSMGPDAKAGVATNVSSSSAHTLAPSSTDADDNVTNPE